MKIRFFYAPPFEHYWPKLYVLTEDNFLYCEYLTFLKPASWKREVNFEKFKSSDYDYATKQICHEISEEEAKRVHLFSQDNWIESYLESIRK